MGLMSVGGAGAGKRISSYVFVETTSTDNSNASIKLSYYENDVLKDTVTKLYTQAMSAAFTFHYVTLKYGSEIWQLGNVSSYGPYDLADGKAAVTGMITPGFTYKSWGYTTSVAMIVYPSSDISKVTIGYLQSVFGG